MSQTARTTDFQSVVQRAIQHVRRTSSQSYKEAYKTPYKSTRSMGIETIRWISKPSTNHLRRIFEDCILISRSARITDTCHIGDKRARRTPSRFAKRIRFRRHICNRLNVGVPSGSNNTQNHARRSNGSSSLRRSLARPSDGSMKAMAHVCFASPGSPE